MITTKDIQQLQKIFATKQELQELRTELKNDILHFKDDILFEIKAMREDLTVVIGYRQIIENHEDRLNLFRT